MKKQYLSDAKIKQIVSRYAKLDREIAERYEAIDKIESNSKNWVGQEGYKHTLKPGANRRIEQLNQGINSRIQAQHGLCSKITYEQFNSFSEQYEIFDVLENEHNWLCIKTLFQSLKKRFGEFANDNGISIGFSSLRVVKSKGDLIEEIKAFGDGNYYCGINISHELALERQEHTKKIAKYAETISKNICVTNSGLVLQVHN